MILNGFSGTAGISPRFRGLGERFPDGDAPTGVPPLKWSTNWDSMIPIFGGPEDGRKAREARGHRFEVAAG
jgi:hypothetical protein